MDPVSVYEARNRLSQLVAAVGEGEDVVIAKRGKPVVRLVPVDGTPQHSAGGAARWLTTNPVPPRAARTPDELDEQVRREREAWD